MSPGDGDAVRTTAGGLEVTAHGSRQALEGLYLEVRELARKRGLEVECLLTPHEAGDPRRT